MKITIITFILFLTFAYSDAQTSYGVRLGLNFSDVQVKLKDSWYQFPDNEEALLGINAGFYASFDIFERLAFRPEIQFVQKGHRLKPFAPTDQPGSKINLSYVQVPLILSVKIMEKLYTDIGPSFGYKVLMRSESDHFLIENYMNQFSEDFEISVLGGLRYSISEKFDISLQYNQGISNITNIGGLFHIENPNTGQIEGFEYIVRNRVLLFFVGYKLF